MDKRERYTVHFSENEREYLYWNPRGDASADIGTGFSWYQNDPDVRKPSPALDRALWAWWKSIEKHGVDEMVSALWIHVDWDKADARGIELARRLKQELGDGYRVLYETTSLNPYHRRHQRREILAGGEAVDVAGRNAREDLCLSWLVKIWVSGGQTGAERAALDRVLQYGKIAGGWCPRGRRAEDGWLPVLYPLRETKSADYRDRALLNVRDSDATLIVNIGALEGGTLATQEFAREMGRPCLVAQLDDRPLESIARQVVEWLRDHPISVLNVAGPRESKQPGIYAMTWRLLDTASEISNEGFLKRLAPSANEVSYLLP